MRNETTPTSINNEIHGSITELNRYAMSSNAATMLNPDVAYNAQLPIDTILCGKYIVQDKLNVQSGEADLYVCTYGRGRYVAKVYRRKVAIKAEVTEALAGVYSPYIAQIFDLGEYNGYPVEILPYYQNGSVQGRQFSFEQLRQNIIPALNEGLKVLHDNGIIHKDLKPSNIMLNADGRTVSIIDFGISSIREEGSTVVVTKTGMTPDYSAPETFRGLFLSESDYYSLGITVYELYAGHTPYAHLQGEELERILSIQTIPLPNDMPEELQILITALTYPDITNRRDKTNPNRRWTYEEVQNWCMGINQPIPGSSADYSLETERKMRPYKFLGNQYTDFHSLVMAFNDHWEEGKKQLFRGLLSEHIKKFDPELAGICMDAEEEVEHGDPDLIFFKTLYELDKDLKSFIWKGAHYSDLTALGLKYLTALQNNDESMDSFIEEVLRKGILSSFTIIQCGGEETQQSQTLKAFETKRKTLGSNTREKKIDNYHLAYMLSGEINLQIDEMSFHTPDELSDYLQKLLNKSLDSFNSFVDKLMNNNKELNIRFESWFVALGKKHEIEAWKRTASK